MEQPASGRVVSDDILWLTVEEVAQSLRLPLSTCYELVRRGRIPSVKLGKHLRIPRDWLDALGRN